MERLLASDSADSEPLSPSIISSSHSSECDIFTRCRPFPRLLFLSIGPLLSQIALSVCGFADSFWVAKACGSDGLAIIGAVFIVDFISVAISEYLITGLSARASFLLGNRNAGDCTQMFVDFLRIAFAAALAIPAFVLPITRPLIEWFGADPDFSLKCFQYMLPPTFGSFVTFAYMICCGQAQAEGRSVTFGALQVGALIAGQFVFNPLLLLFLRTPIWGASLARICGEAISAITGLWLVFGGHFRIRPNVRMFIAPFSRDTFAAMRLGLAEFISVCSETLPMVLLQKYVNDAAIAIGVYETVLEVWGVLERVYQFVVGICVAFSIGMLPSAAHAYGARHYRDCLATSLHALWFTTFVSVSLSVGLIFCPERICQLWSDDPTFLEWAGKMIPRCFYMAPSFGMLFMVPVLYEAMQKCAASSIIAFMTQMFPLPVFATVMHFTGKNDPARVLWAYCLTDGFAFVVCGAFYIWSVRKILRTPTTVEEVMSKQRKVRGKSDPGVKIGSCVDVNTE